ncbi:MAG: hypothetical protein WA435_05275 [Gallionellaceae bacterium]
MRILMVCLMALLLHANISMAREDSQGPIAKPMDAHSALTQDKAESAADLRKLTRIRAPILSQVLMFASPKEFKTTFHDMDDKKFTQEFLMEGESVDKYTQMISVIAYKDLALSPLASPAQFATGVANLFRRNCPDAYSGASLGARKIDGFDAYAAIMSCGLVKPEDPYSEASLFIVIRGDKDFYTLQWTERGMAIHSPIRFDQAKWKARMDSLAPIKLCSDKSGEFPLYANCFKPKLDNPEPKK